MQNAILLSIQHVGVTDLVKGITMTGQTVIGRDLITGRMVHIFPVLSPWQSDNSGWVDNLAVRAIKHGHLLLQDSPLFLSQ